jgi:transcription-repair coupling factor (superfamily II helicase)
VRELQGESVAHTPSAVIDLPVAMTIPEEYIADTNLRMEIYQRAAKAVDGGELRAELRDRFGALPPSVDALIEVGQLKILAESIGVQAIAARGRRLQVRLRRDSTVDLARLVQWIAERKGASFTPSGVLAVELEAGSDILRLARETLEGIVGES